MKTQYILTALIIIFAAIAFFLYKFGVFHGAHSWPEYKFQGENIELLRNYLDNKQTILEDVTSFSSEVTMFQFLTGKKLSSSQKLYRFSGGKEHEFWFFPIGTQNYSMYVLVDNGKIILFQEDVCIDSL